jgi:Sulfotransferase family
MQKITFEREPKLAESAHQCGPPPTAGEVQATGQISAATKPRLNRLLAWRRRNGARELWDWARCKRVTLPTAEHLAEVLMTLDTRTSRVLDTEKATEPPIFLLAAGWRSGSTLLQRILVTDPRLPLWGEPFGEMALVSGIVEMLIRISTFPRLEGLYAQHKLTSSSLARSWIANLYPPGDDFRRALRRLFDRWLGEPGRERGFVRWGFKEVRLSASEATFLHWLYPQAKFVLLARHPYDCYRSLSDSGWHHIYYRRPDLRVDSAAGIARHWNRVVTSWSELPVGFPSFHVKYEDLISSAFDFRKLESWLGVEIEEDIALSVRVRPTAVRNRLSWCERMIISCEAATGMRALGYSESLS